MKKLTLYLSITLLSFSMYSQNGIAKVYGYGLSNTNEISFTQSNNNVIITNELKMGAHHGLEFIYELPLGKHFSLSAGAGFSFVDFEAKQIANNVVITSTNEKSSGSYFSLAPRYYFSGETSMQGLYLSPYISFSSNSFEEMNVEYKTKSTNLMLNCGYQWIFDSGLALDLYIGLGNSNVKSDLNIVSKSEFTALSGIGIGYQF